MLLNCNVIMPVLRKFKCTDFSMKVNTTGYQQFAAVCLPCDPDGVQNAYQQSLQSPISS